MPVDDPSASDPELTRRVRAILYEFWDPVGISNAPAASREGYDLHLDQVVRLVRGGAAEDAIQGTLLRIEHEVIGLAGDPEHAGRVARQLVRLGRTWQSD